MSVQNILQALQKNSDPDRAKFSTGFFPATDWNKLDKFYGGSVPSTRLVAKQFQESSLQILLELFKSGYHEGKLCALMILRFQLQTAFKHSKIEEIQKIKQFYLSNVDYINHWDLVDESSNSVLGDILVFECLMFLLKNRLNAYGLYQKGLLEFKKGSLNFKKDQKREQNEIILSKVLAEFKNIKGFKDPKYTFKELQRLASSENIWYKRISIISQFSFLKLGNIDIALSICQEHIDHKHHYVQKAVGWILREVGKINKPRLDQFLKKNIKRINSICLSYALEKHSLGEKKLIRSLR